MLTVLTNLRSTKVLWLVEDNLRWKTSSKQGRRLRFGMFTILTNIWLTKVVYDRWTTNFGGRWPMVRDNFRWKTIFGGRRPFVEYDLWWKTTFDGRRLLVEDDLRPRTTNELKEIKKSWPKKFRWTHCFHTLRTTSTVQHFFLPGGWSLNLTHLVLFLFIYYYLPLNLYCFLHGEMDTR